MHRAVPRNGTRLRVHSIARNHIVDLFRDRGWNERAVFAPLRATGVAALFAKAGAVDGARKAVHGIPAVGDATLSALRPRRATRTRGSNLGELLFAFCEYRLLDEGQFYCRNDIVREAFGRVRAHARARSRQRRLFHWRKISLSKTCFCKFPTPWRLAGVHARAFKNGTRTGSFCVCRFYGGMVSHLQI